jgi:hypothetical protein
MNDNLLIIKTASGMNRALLFLFCLFCLNSAFAVTFEVGGIMYSTIPDSKNVMVISKDSRDAYSGDVVIPPSVSYEGTSYMVTSIGDDAFNALTESLQMIDGAEAQYMVSVYGMNGCICKLSASRCL